MKQYKKYILSLLGILLILLVIIVKQYARDNPDTDVGQADKYRPYLEFISGALGNQDLEYTYVMTMHDESKHADVDSIKGHLCKSNDNFIDSNNTGVNMLMGGLFCRIDKVNRQVFVCRLSVMENRLGIKKEDLNNMAFSITDSMIKRLGNLSLQPVGDDMVLSCTMTGAPDGIKKLMFVMDKDRRHMKKVNIVISDGNNSAYTRILTMSGFSNKPATAINTGKYFTIHDKKVILNKFYKDYKLKAAI